MPEILVVILVILGILFIIATAIGLVFIVILWIRMLRDWDAFGGRRR